MPHGAAVVGLRYSGTDLQRSDLSVFLEIASGLHDGLQVRGRDQIIPRAAGRLALPRRGDRRVIELVGHISGVGSTADAQAESFRTVALELEALFDQTVTDTLEATLEDGTVMTIEARTIEPHFFLTKIPIRNNVEIDLESVDPNWVAAGS